MGSLDSTETLVPYMKTTDCSQGFCSSYCPQWCYVIFPPPPFEFSDENSSPSFSPLVVAIIGVLASAFLLVSYYTIVSKFCGSMDSTRRERHNYPNADLEGNYGPSNHEPWHVSGDGLDEVMIKSITVFKYKKGDGLIEGTDCSVCLNEFQESENLRLLPKCSHAFHVKCIDTWLRSHSNCPLCRANVVHLSTFTLQPPLPEPEAPMNPGIYIQGHRESDIVEADVREEELMQTDDIAKTPARADSNLGNPADRDAVLEIGEVEYQQIRRSVSMSNLCQARVCIADVMCIDQDEEDDAFTSEEAGSSRKPVAEMSKISHRNQVLHSVKNPDAMKRIISSERFSFPTHGREKNIAIPL